MNATKRRTLGTRFGPLAISCAVFFGGCKCHKDEDKKGNPNQAATVEGRATTRELLTKVGTARGLQSKNKDVPVPSTAVQWKYVVPLDAENAVLGGTLAGEAVALRTEDGGRSWTTMRALVDGANLITYSVGADKTLVVAVTKRQIPKKKLGKDEIPPIDTLTLYFQTPGEKLSAASPIFAATEKDTGPFIPAGRGHQAVLSKTLASFGVQMGPKMYGIAYGTPPGVDLPPITPLPAGETPVYAGYGRPPVLLTVNGKDLLARPWPNPGEALVAPKPVEHVVMSKTLVDELSEGPECENGAWSFKRYSGGKDRTLVLAVSKDKQTSFELPPTIDNTRPMACNGERVTIEAKDPTKNNEPALVTCSIDGTCIIPDNHAFLRPWGEKHDRQVAMTTWKKGIVAVQTLSNSAQWTYLLSESDNGGKVYDMPRAVGEGKGERGRFEIGALVGLGDRTVMLLSSDITGTSARAWYLMASDDGGQTWTPP